MNIPLNDLIRRNFTAALMVGFVIGFFAPGLDQLPKALVLFVLALVIFFSCSQISRDEFRQIHYKEALGFTLLRFVLLPVVIYFAIRPFVPDMAEAVFLLCLVPAGVSVGALCAISGGNTTLGLGITVLSSLMAPFSIPLLFLSHGNEHFCRFMGVVRHACHGYFCAGRSLGGVPPSFQSQEQPKDIRAILHGRGDGGADPFDCGRAARLFSGQSRSDGQGPHYLDASFRRFVSFWMGRFSKIPFRKPCGLCVQFGRDEFSACDQSGLYLFPAARHLVSGRLRNPVDFCHSGIPILSQENTKHRAFRRGINKPT